MVRRVVSVLLVGLLLVAALVVRGGGTAAHADQEGYTKISQLPTPDTRARGGDDHVACAFYILGYHMPAVQGNSVVVTAGKVHTVVVSDPYTGTADSRGAYGFVKGPYYLAPGHYKSLVTNAKGRKISDNNGFWVDGPCSPPAPPPPPPSCGTSCGAPSSVVVSHQAMHLAALSNARG